MLKKWASLHIIHEIGTYVIQNNNNLKCHSFIQLQYKIIGSGAIHNKMLLIMNPAWIYDYWEKN